MINGNGHMRFDPTGDIEVSDILPTATGLYLEEMRKACQRNPRDVCNETRNECYLVIYFIFLDEEGEDESFEEEVVSGTPYRGGQNGPLHPFDHWFQKPKNGTPQKVCVQTDPPKKA